MGNTIKAIFEVLLPYIIAALIGVSVSFALKLIYNPIMVNGSSMYPTYSNGNFLSCENPYAIEDIDYGDIVVFKHYRKSLIKRVIAKPNDTIKIIDGQVYVNDVKSPYEFETIKEPGILKDEIKLEDDEFFCMGDNRNNSFDCREFGPIKFDSIEKRVIKKIY